MKKRKDINEEELEQLILPYETRAQLPIYTDQSIETQEPVKKASFHVPIAFVVVIAICLIIAICPFLLLKWIKPRNEPQKEITLEKETQTEWRGAFAQRNIYENCLKSSVTVRVERGSGGNYWSGFVYSENGLVATSLEAMEEAKGGRMYVVFNDGAQYLVDSIISDRESGLALLKISAQGLVPVRFREEFLQSGEEVISMNAGSDNKTRLAFGALSMSLDETLDINIYSSKESIGAPIYDADGYLVAVTCFWNEKENEYEAVSAQKCREIFAKMADK